MSPWTIVYQRWKRHLKHQIKLFSSIVDGVVALYIFIPALLILGYHLIELWQGSATWPTYLSFSGIIILLYIWSLTGRFSFFVEGADRIILRQHEGLMKGLQRYAVSFSAVHSLLSCILLFIVLAPVLLQYFKLSALGMLLLFGLSLAVKLLHHSLKSYFILPFRTWRKWSLALVILLLDFSLFLGAGLLTRSVATEHTASWVTSSFNFPIPYTPVLVILIMGYMITATLLMLRRTSIPWAFTFDCLQEEEQKYRAIGFLIKQSQNIGGPDLSRNKPWKKSSLLYFLLPSRKVEKWQRQGSKGAVTGLFYRFFLRHRMRVMALLRVQGVFIAAIFFTPGLFKWGMWFLGICVISIYLRGTWNEWVEHEFKQLFVWKESMTKKEAVHSIFIPALVVSMILSFSLGSVLQSVVLGLVAICIGGLLTYGLLLSFQLQLRPLKEG